MDEQRVIFNGMIDGARHATRLLPFGQQMGAKMLIDTIETFVGALLTRIEILEAKIEQLPCQR